MYLFILLFHIHHFFIIHLFFFSKILAILLLLIQGEIKVIDALPTPLPNFLAPPPQFTRAGCRGGVEEGNQERKLSNLYVN